MYQSVLECTKVYQGASGTSVCDIFTFSLGSIRGDIVEDIDEDKEDCDEERHSPGNRIRGNNKTDPRNHHK